MIQRAGLGEERGASSDDLGGQAGIFGLSVGRFVNVWVFV